MEEERKRMHERIDRRGEVLQHRIDRMHRLIDSGVLDGSEDGRAWLEKHCVGVGVQLCPGDFSLGESIGIDTDPVGLGTDVWGFVDPFAGNLPPLDYIVTNYLEHFPNPLTILEEWAARLRPGGIMAIVCRNADVYRNPRGPLSNKRRYHCFTLRTLTCYLARVELKVTEWEVPNKELRVVAAKTSEGLK